MKTSQKPALFHKEILHIKGVFHHSVLCLNTAIPNINSNIEVEAKLNKGQPKSSDHNETNTFNSQHLVPRSSQQRKICFLIAVAAKVYSSVSFQIILHNYQRHGVETGVTSHAFPTFLSNKANLTYSQ